jgi:metallo-beta-lactamase class B
MFAKPIALTSLCALALLACAPKENMATDKSFQSNGRAELVKACEGRDGWSDPAPPAQVFGNVYMVGTCGIVSLLITSNKGHILIDGATKEAAPSIEQNIRKLGFNPKDVRYLLYTHEHLDHVGGLAALKQITGAIMVARLEAKASLESGVPEKADPQFGGLPAFPGVKVDQLIKDGEIVSLGPLALKAIASPGHAPGGTSWTWRSCEGSVCHSFVYADSLGSVSADGYRFSDHPQYVSVFRATIARIASIASCDILITPHPSQSQFFERLSGSAPLIKQTACADYAAAARDRLDARLAKEEATK